MRAGPLPPAAALAVALASWCGPVACGDDDGGPAPRERADAPASAPAGWRTVENARAGFTISVPRRWRVRTRRDVTIVRSPDRLAVATTSADRTSAGRDTPPADYASAVVQRLPGFEGSVSPNVRDVAGSPYPSARVDAAGRVDTSPGGQTITVAAFHRPGRVAYSIVVFRNGSVALERHRRAVRRVLASLRARPAGEPGRGGR